MGTIEQSPSEAGRATGATQTDDCGILASRWVAAATRRLAAEAETAADSSLPEQLTGVLARVAPSVCADLDRDVWRDEAVEERLALIGRWHAERGGSLSALLHAFSVAAEALCEAAEEWLRQHPDRMNLSARLARVPLQMAEIAGAAYQDALLAPAVAAEVSQAAPGVDATRLLAACDPEEPLAERVRRGIAAGVHFGLLRPGDRLPSVRAVAAAGGVDHRAVGAAYRALGAAGLVEIRGRQGAYVGQRPPAPEVALGETAEWAGGVLREAAALRIRAAQVPTLLQRAVADPLRCLCVECVEDELVALEEEAAGQWGMIVRTLRSAPDAAAEIASAAHEVDVILTTAFMAGAADAAGRAARRPVVYLAAASTFVAEVTAALTQAPLTVLVADPRYADRLRILPHADRMTVLVAQGPADLQASDGRAVLATSAARRRLGNPRLRMLVAPAEFVSQEAAPALAALVVAHTLGPPGSIARIPGTAAAPVPLPEVA